MMESLRTSMFEGGVLLCHQMATLASLETQLWAGLGEGCLREMTLFAYDALRMSMRLEKDFPIGAAARKGQDAVQWPGT